MKRYPALILLLIGVLALAAPLISPFDPFQTNPEAYAQPPGIPHLLGTDHLGRDILSRILYGGQQTLLTAGLATTLAAALGLLLGGIPRIISPRLDRIINIIVETLLAFPGLLLALVIVTVMEQNTTTLAVAVGITQAAVYARVARAAVMSVESSAFIESAIALGARKPHIIYWHILPNSLPVLLAHTGTTFAYSIINSAALSFLGLGGDPSIPDWGTMLAAGRAVFRSAPWAAFFPGLFITIVVISVNQLVDSFTARK